MFKLFFLFIGVTFALNLPQQHIANLAKVKNVNVKNVVDALNKDLKNVTQQLTDKYKDALGDRFNAMDANQCSCPCPAPSDTPTPAPAPTPAPSGNVNAGAQSQPTGPFKMTQYGNPPASSVHCVANSYSPAAWSWSDGPPGTAGVQFKQGNWVALTQTLMEQIPPYDGALGTKTPGCGSCVQASGSTKSGKQFTSPILVVADQCATAQGSPWFDQNCVNIPDNIDFTTSAFSATADWSCGEVYDKDGCGNVQWQFVPCS